MLVKRWLILVALLFLGSTVVLFMHLQELIEPASSSSPIQDTFIDSNPQLSTPMDSSQSPQSPAQLPPAQHTPPIESEPPSTTIASAEKENEQHNNNLEDVHIFYYPWYANPDIDGKWSHWNHNILPHWNEQTRKQFKYDVQYQPPDDIGANYYPELGTYSSKDPKVLQAHMAELSGYVVVISWWGMRGADGEGSPTNEAVPAILKAAEKNNVQIAIHLEPYTGRNAKTVKQDIKYIYDTYGHSKALYRSPKHNNRIVIYIYDSYHTPALEWASIFSPHGRDTIRGTPNDAVAIGLYLEQKDKAFIENSHFDGFYTYFAANGFTEGSSIANWAGLAQWAKDKSLLFSCSVGPGYDDTRIRPWNSANKKSRNNGEYYDTQWKTAMSANPSIISVTSYNEWHEGTQIEAAIPKTLSTTIYDSNAYSYEDYQPHAPDYYMTKTYEYALQFTTSKQT